MTDWHHLGAQVQARRNDLALTQDELIAQVNALAGKKIVSVPTLQKIENARADGYRPSTFLWISRALRWPDNALDRLAAGEFAADIPTRVPASPDGDESWDDLRSSLSPEDQASVRAIIESLRSKGHP